MDIIEVLGVMEEGLVDFFESLSYLQVLLITLAFSIAVFSMCMAHIILGAKASTTRKANKVARYFNTHYIGSCLDARKFLRRKRRWMNKSAREEFAVFTNSTTNIKDTDFAYKMMERGRYSLGMVLPFFNSVIVMSGVFAFAKGYSDVLVGIELMMYTAMPVVVGFVLKGLLALTIHIVNVCYMRAKKRLRTAEDSIRYNNEYTQFRFGDDANDLMDRATNDSGVEEVIKRMQEVESTLDGDSQQAIVDGISDIKDVLSSEDKAKYDEFLARLDTKNA